MSWCIYVDWRPRRWEELTEKLEQCKLAAGAGDVPEEMTGWGDGDNRIEVEPTGAKSGKGRKGLYCPRMFAYGDLLRFRLVNRCSVHRTMPNVYVTADGKACTINHAEHWFRRAKELIESLGGIINEDKLSRVDICLDMPGVPLDEFVSCFDHGRYICRANARAKMESNGVTVQFGQSPIMARICDKLREVKKKADPVKTLAMQINRWGGGWPAEATRVEFQLRRDGLKTRGIDSVQDYLDRRASLAEYLTTQWLRLTQDHVDKQNKNQGKASTLPLWQDVSDRMVAWGGCENVPLNPLPVGRADITHLMKQILGVARAAARYQGKEGLSNAELIAYAAKKCRALGRCHECD